jgi:hypothetical protein
MHDELREKLLQNTDIYPLGLTLFYFYYEISVGFYHFCFASGILGQAQHVFTSRGIVDNYLKGNLIRCVHSLFSHQYRLRA